MTVKLGSDFKRQKILMDLNGNVYDDIKKFKQHEPNPNGKNYIDINTPETPIPEKVAEVQLEGVVRPTNGAEVNGGGNEAKTDSEQIRIAVLNSDLKDSDKVFMMMLLKDKSRSDAINLILTSPIKDVQKVNLMKSI